MQSDSIGFARITTASNESSLTSLIMVRSVNQPAADHRLNGMVITGIVLSSTVLVLQTARMMRSISKANIVI
jgi:hypothetical protein